MSIYKRPPYGWAVMIDADDKAPWRITSPLPPTKNERRRSKVVEKFKTEAEARKAFARLTASGNKDGLAVERLARGRRYLGMFETRKAAEVAERAALTALDHGINVDPTKLTMTELVDRFIDSREANGKSGTTTYDYRRKWELYARDRIGEVPARKLQKAHLAELYADLRRAGGRDAGPLSPKTILHVHGLVHAVLEWAVRHDVLERNVAHSLRDGDLPRVERHEAQAHDPVAIAKLLENEEGSREWPLVALAIAVGMRRGELAALRWEHVNFDERTITVAGSYAEIPGRVWLKAPKSYQSRRIDLPDLALRALQRRRKIQVADMLRGGGHYRDDGYVFAPEGGGHYNPNGLYKAFARAAKRAGLALTKLHAARHSYATWMIANGEPIATVSRLLGHAQIATTLRIYTHDMDGAGKAAVLTIDAVLAEASRQQNGNKVREKA